MVHKNTKCNQHWAFLKSFNRLNAHTWAMTNEVYIRRVQLINTPATIYYTLNTNDYMAMRKIYCVFASYHFVIIEMIQLT